MIPCSKRIADFKAAIAEHESKHKTLPRVGPSKRGLTTARVMEGDPYHSLPQPDGFPRTWGFQCHAGQSQLGPSTLVGSASQGASVALRPLSLCWVQLPGLDARVSPMCRCCSPLDPTGWPGWCGPAAPRVECGKLFFFFWQALKKKLFMTLAKEQGRLYSRRVIAMGAGITAVGERDCA